MNLPHLNAPLVTPEDIARGFAEAELQLNDGTRQSFRIHVLDPEVFVSAAARWEQQEAQIQVVAQSLRETPEFVRERLHPISRVVAGRVLLNLVCGEQEGSRIFATAVTQALDNAAQAATGHQRKETE